MNKLVIVGAGGLGRSVAWLVERINLIKPTWEMLGYIDENKLLMGKMIGKYKVIGNNDWLLKNKSDVYAVCAIANAKIRRQVVQSLCGVKYAALIDPSVIISDRVEIGEGCIICAGSIITVDIKIGAHSVIETACTIGHDAILSDFTTLYPGANISGNVILGGCNEIGTGSQVIQGIRIGEGTIVGAGAVVVHDLPDNCTAVGVPAKPIK